MSLAMKEYHRAISKILQQVTNTEKKLEGIEVPALPSDPAYAVSRREMLEMVTKLFDLIDQLYQMNYPYPHQSVQIKGYPNTFYPLDSCGRCHFDIPIRIVNNDMITLTPVMDNMNNTLGFEVAVHKAERSLK